MLQVTSDAKKFFQDNTDVIYIYGAGNPGHWVAEYMSKCNINFEGFIDKGVSTDDCFLHGKRIIHPQRLHSLGHKFLKIIIAVGKPKEVLAELPWYVKDIDVLCLVPIYKDFIDKNQIYDINRFLGYFRKQLITTELPTILSNSCNAGFIYRALGETMISPTINISIQPEEFMKICRNPREYLSQDIVFDHWTLFYGRRNPVGRIKDVEVVFAHSDDAEESVRRWNKLRKWINWERMIYILSNEAAMIPYQIAKEFCALPTKHLLIIKDNMYSNSELGGAIYVNHAHFHIRDSAIENWFDLLGWINGEYEF